MLALVAILAGIAVAGPARNLLELGTLPGSWSYSYGGATSGELRSEGSGKLVTYKGDDKEYSGWTLHLPDRLDLDGIRSQGALKIRIKGRAGGENIFIGLIGDESNKKVQVRVPTKNFGQIDKDWKTFTIPLAEFDDQGSWWDEKAKQEISGKIDWSRIAEVRISSNRGANASKTDSASLFQVQISEWTILDTSDIWNAAAHWKRFKSDAPDDTLERFVGGPSVKNWFVAGDDESKRDLKSASAEYGPGLELSYKMASWVTIGASPRDLPSPSKGNWTRHAGMALEVWSPRNGVGLQIQLTDSGKEQWVKNVHLAPGWNTVAVPFQAFIRNSAWQPDGAIANGRLDLESVRTLGFQPLDRGEATTLRIKSIRLTNSLPGFKKETAPNQIRWNHLGYAPKAFKRFVVADPTDSVFELRDEGGKSVFRGKLAKAGKWDASEEDVAQGDFSGFDKSGSFVLSTGGANSLPFRIGNAPYGRMLDNSIRAFYFQRASVDLPAKHAGIWQRKGGHPDTGLSLFEAGREGYWSAPGGWYDAGDYGKYTLNGAVTVGILLQAYELFPKLFPDKALNIPESGNGVSDLLDECIWELDWMAKMQDQDGGLFFKVASRQWDGMEMPTATKLQRFVIGKSTSATLTFAASAAQAARVLKSVDAKRSKEYLDRAEKAWGWAKRNPLVREPRETGGSGPYEDSNMSDEFLWAAVELWLATGKPEYRTAAKAGFDTVSILQTANWQNVQNLAYYDAALLGDKDSLTGIAKRRIDSMASEIRKQIEENPYRAPLQGFPWASNDAALQKAALLVWADHFRNGAAGSGIQETVDYVLGKNATGHSFVTGTGERSAMRPHHRVMAGDGIEPPFPGFLVGGPNAGREDDIKNVPWGVAYDHTEPAKCWMDAHQSYASNEVAINWNAALVFTLAALTDKTGGR